MYPVIQLLLYTGYFVVHCDNIFTSLPNYPEVKMKLPKLWFEKLDHIMSHTTGSFCSKPVITNLEQLFFTINKYKEYLYRIDAGRIYHCKLLGQFEFKSEFLPGLTKNWYIISHDLLRLNISFSSFRLMLSHYKLCRKNYVQVADSDKRTDFFASVHVQYCGIRPPFIYYSTNPFLRIKLFQESSEIMSSFEFFYQSVDSEIISSGQDYSMDSFGYIIQS